MPRLVFTAAAQADLLAIADYIQDTTGSVDVAERFVERLIKQCERLASFDTIMGRSRDDLLPGLRSVPVGAYLIFIRYVDAAVLEVIDIVHGSRDIQQVFQTRD